eukprot:7510960-Prorocentrum_lima.AAC.1
MQQACARGGGRWAKVGLVSSRVLLRRASSPPWWMEWRTCCCAQDDASARLPAVADAPVLAHVGAEGWSRRVHEGRVGGPGGAWSPPGCCCGALPIPLAGGP